MTTNTRIAAIAAVGFAAFFTIGYAAGGAGKEPVDTMYTGPSTMHNNTVSVTPDASCLQALDAADNGFKLTIKIINAIGNNDVAALPALKDEIEPTLTPYRINRDACRTN